MTRTGLGAASAVSFSLDLVAHVPGPDMLLEVEGGASCVRTVTTILITTVRMSGAVGHSTEDR